MPEAVIRTVAPPPGLLASLDPLLREWLPRQRWFAGKGRPITGFTWSRPPSCCHPVPGWACTTCSSVLAARRRALNARGVRVAGGFNFWDGAGYPMRSLGSSGVWELFVPGVGEGELYKFEITRPEGARTLRADPWRGVRRSRRPPRPSSRPRGTRGGMPSGWRAAAEVPADGAPSRCTRCI
ncbi:1,4-alpha-glucan branching enzyme GlgB [Streptomyces hirsutus]